MKLHNDQTAHLFKKYAAKVKELDVFSEKDIQRFQNFLALMNIECKIPSELVLDVLMSIQWGLRRFARSDDIIFYYHPLNSYESRFLYEKGSQVLPPDAFLAPYVRSYKKTYAKAYFLMLDILNDLLPRVIDKNQGRFFKGITLIKVESGVIGFKFEPISIQDMSLLWIP